MTIFFCTAYTIWDKDLRDGIPIFFSLADYYADCRTFVRNFFKFYAMNAVYAILCGLFIFMIGMASFASDLGEGKQSDLYTYGVVMTTT